MIIMHKTIKKNDLKQRVAKLLKESGIKKAGIFGSFARGKEKKSSDIDILVEFDGSLLEFVKLERELNEKLGRKVDLVTYNGINPLLKEKILDEEVRIL